MGYYHFPLTMDAPQAAFGRWRSANNDGSTYFNSLVVIKTELTS